MFTFLFLNLKSLVVAGTACYGVLYLCDVCTEQKFFFGRYFVKGLGFRGGLPYFFCIAVLLPPISWLLAIYATLRWMWWARKQKPAGS